MTRLRPLLAAFAALLVLSACGGGSSSGPAPGATGDFAAVERQARGQTVRWWMYGGDPRINRFVDRYVVPAARAKGVRLQRVPVTDTADALARIVAERRAGKRSGGGVDLVWLNGENFATGKSSGLWLRDWAGALPGAAKVDATSPLIASDFRVPVDGQESPWSGAAFVFVRDAARTARPPRTFGELLAYAKAHPGRVAYPAPPDFTGSAFVRQVVQRAGSVRAGIAYLRELEPFTYREGRVHPKSEQELSQLFADGKVDFAMSYSANVVDDAVRKGTFPRTARPFLIGGGALQNTSYVTIPSNAAHPAGAKVVADLLLTPRLQAIAQDPKVLGLPTVLRLDRLSAADRGRFDAVASPYLLRSFGTALTELAADRVAPIEEAWKREVLR